jgi:hypothetical protein
MAFDPTKPVEGTPVDAAEMRGQLNALKALIDAQQTQIAALQTALAGKASMPQMSQFDPGFLDPPTTADLEAIRDCINEMLQDMQNP